MHNVTPTFRMRKRELSGSKSSLVPSEFQARLEYTGHLVGKDKRKKKLERGEKRRRESIGKRLFLVCGSF